MTSSIAELKARYSIPHAWRDLGLEGEPEKICRSPFPGDHKNGDAHPSFSVFAEGTRWKNQATGEGGDVFDLIKKARGTDIAGAVEWVRERLGHGAKSRDYKPQAKLPELRQGTPLELEQLARLRNLHNEAVALASSRGFLFFGSLWGHKFWAITDQRRALVEFRRLDGAPWPAYGRLTERKSHCLGSGKDWPVGVLEAAASSAIAWLEGAPDFLAFWHFAWIEGKVEKVAPVAMLGAANQRVAADALRCFQGKTVVLYPHCDDAGRVACKAWARQLRDAGASIAAFDLSGIEKEDGAVGKDLNDLCDISADCFENAANHRFREVLP